MLGLGNNLKKTGLTTPGIVTDSLVMKHMYNAGAVQPLSDGAAFFDGTDDYISVTATTLSVHDEAHSFSFWINLNSADGDANGWDIILGDDDQFYNTIAIDMENDRILIEGTVDGDNLQWSTLQNPVPSHTWQHFVIATDGAGSAKGYQNGVEMTRLSASDTIASDFTFNKIGRAGTTPYMLDGYLCNLGIWSRQLTQAEIKSIMWKSYADLSTSEKASLVSWWNLDSTIDSTATLGNTVVYDNHNATLGDNLVNNPTFDGGVQSPWTDRNISGDEYIQTSTEQSYTGSYSLKINAVENSSGANGFLTETTVAGKLYRISAWVYVVSGVAEINPSDGAFGAYDPAGDEEVQSTTTGQWEELVTYAWCDSAVGSGIATFFLQANAGAALFYVDNVKVQIVQGNPGELK